MNITIRPETKEEFAAIDELVLNSFAKGTPYSDGKLEIALIAEIRAGEYYIPSLSFVAELEGELVGHFLFSRFPLSRSAAGGDYLEKADGIVILTPVAVDYRNLRQGIGSKMLRLGLGEARAAGCRAAIVEGNPAFYHKVGFVTSGDLGLHPSDNVRLPKPECLMAQELTPGALNGITGYVDYGMYETIGQT